MLENLFFSLDCVMPYFLLIVLGALIQKKGLVPKSFFKGANRFTFKVALPFQLFYSIAVIENKGPGTLRFMLYVLFVGIASFLVIWAVTELIYKDKTIVGTLVQGAFRGNFVLIGAPLAGSVLGDKAMQTAAVASIVVIPTYNILSVIILLARGNSRGQSAGSIVRGIITNPLIIGMCLALPFLVFNLHLPKMVMQTIQYVGQTGTPLGLLSIGGMINIADATARLKPALYSSLIKNVLLPAVVMPVSYLIGYRGEELLILLVLTAAPVAISSYIMASEMGGDATLASNILILSTFFSGFVLAAGIYILRSYGLI